MKKNITLLAFLLAFFGFATTASATVTTTRQASATPTAGKIYLIHAIGGYYLRTTNGNGDNNHPGYDYEWHEMFDHVVGAPEGVNHAEQFVTLKASELEGHELDAMMERFYWVMNTTTDDGYGNTAYFTNCAGQGYMGSSTIDSYVGSGTGLAPCVTTYEDEVLQFDLTKAAYGTWLTSSSSSIADTTEWKYTTSSSDGSTITSSEYTYSAYSNGRNYTYNEFPVLGYPMSYYNTTRSRYQYVSVGTNPIESVTRYDFFSYNPIGSTDATEESQKCSAYMNPGDAIHMIWTVVFCFEEVNVNKLVTLYRHTDDYIKQIDQYDDHGDYSYYASLYMPYTVSLVVGKNGYETGDLKAYQIGDDQDDNFYDGGTVTLRDLQLSYDGDGYPILPSYTPVLLKLDKAYYYSDVEEDTVCITASMYNDQSEHETITTGLTGVLAKTTLVDYNWESEDPVYSIYALGRKGGRVAFYRRVGSTSGESAYVNAYTAYYGPITTETESAANALTFLFTDDTTDGITAAEAATETADEATYDLQGRRVAKPTRGIYIQNGKKIVVK